MSSSNLNLLCVCVWSRHLSSRHRPKNVQKPNSFLHSVHRLKHRTDQVLHHHFQIFYQSLEPVYPHKQESKHTYTLTKTHFFHLLKRNRHTCWIHCTMYCSWHQGCTCQQWTGFVSHGESLSLSPGGTGWTLVLGNQWSMAGPSADHLPTGQTGTGSHIPESRQKKIM